MSGRPAFAQTAAAAPQPTTYLNLPLDVAARPVPQLVAGEDGRRYLLYRLYVTSWLDVDLRFRSVEVLDAATGRALASYDAGALSDPRRQRVTRWIESDSISPANLALPAGRTSTIAVGISLAATDAPPAALLHRITFDTVPTIRIQTESGTPTETLVATSEPLHVERSPPPVLSPPLRGSNWRCSNGQALSNSHAALVIQDLRLRVPQRYGCDFQRVDSAGSILPNPFPNDITNEMFYGYGAEVLAVADGVIVSVQDGIPDNVPQADGRTLMPVPLTNRTNPGNWLALDLGNGRYAFYAHLVPGSIRVRPGERVVRGTVLGRLGNSGNSVGPHLHFHVGDTPSLNGTEGQPYVFDRYWVLGRGQPNPKERPSEQAMTVPLDGAVLAFPTKCPGDSPRAVRPPPRAESRCGFMERSSLLHLRRRSSAFSLRRGGAGAPCVVGTQLLQRLAPARRAHGRGVLGHQPLQGCAVRRLLGAGSGDGHVRAHADSLPVAMRDRALQPRGGDRHREVGPQHDPTARVGPSPRLLTHDDGATQRLQVVR